mgnify:CR=1 FL=1
MLEKAPTIEEILKAGDDIFRASPFLLLLTRDEDPTDRNWVLDIIFLRWLARNRALLDASVGSTVAAAPSLADTLACIKAAFQDEIPGSAFDPELLEFTLDYFCFRAPYPSDFFSLFPQSDMPSPEAMWDKIAEGTVQKFLKEVSLADQVFVKAADGKQTVAAMLKAANTTIKGFTLYVVGEGIEKKADDFAAEVAAQVAAAKAAA